jgi:hypothetical protein
MGRLQRERIRRLCELQLAIVRVMDGFIGECHEAAARAPRHWREFWEGEAHVTELEKQSMVNRVQEMIDCASGKFVESLCEKKSDADGE